MDQILIFVPGYVSVHNRFAWDFLGKYMFSMVIQGVVCLLATLAIQHKVWTLAGHLWFGSSGDNDGSEAKEGEDEDVTRERQRVMAGEANG